MLGIHRCSWIDTSFGTASQWPIYRSDGSTSIKLARISGWIKSSTIGLWDLEMNLLTIVENSLRTQESCKCGFLKTAGLNLYIRIKLSSISKVRSSYAQEEVCWWTLRENLRKCYGQRYIRLFQTNSEKNTSHLFKKVFFSNKWYLFLYNYDSIYSHVNEIYCD